MSEKRKSWTKEMREALDIADDAAEILSGLGAIEVSGAQKGEDEEGTFVVVELVIRQNRNSDK